MRASDRKKSVSCKVWWASPEGLKEKRRNSRRTKARWALLSDSEKKVEVKNFVKAGIVALQTPEAQRRRLIGIKKNVKRQEWRENLSRGQKKRIKRQGGVTALVKYSFSKTSKTEKRVLKLLRNAGLVCEAQFRIPNTNYTADIFIPDANLIVEVDGHPFHYEQEGIARDKKRDRRIRKLGYSVLRLRLLSFHLGHVKKYSRCLELVLKAVA